MHSDILKTYNFVAKIIKEIGLPVRIRGCWDDDVLYYCVRNKDNTKFIALSTKEKKIKIVRQPLKNMVIEKKIYNVNRNWIASKTLFSEKFIGIKNVEGAVNAYKFILPRL